MLCQGGTPRCTQCARHTGFIAEIEANAGDRRAARRILEAAQADNEDSAALAVALARLSVVEGDTSAARGHYERSLALDSLLSPREMLRFASESLPPKEQSEIFTALEPRFGDEHDLYNNFAWLLATTSDDHSAIRRVPCDWRGAPSNFPRSQMPIISAHWLRRRRPTASLRLPWQPCVRRADCPMRIRFSANLPRKWRRLFSRETRSASKNSARGFFVFFGFFNFDSMNGWVGLGSFSEGKRARRDFKTIFSLTAMG